MSVERNLEITVWRRHRKCMAVHAGSKESAKGGTAARQMGDGVLRRTWLYARDACALIAQGGRAHAVAQKAR
ncbi:hypothetical protein U1Q18_033644 [Sarracenia purpurea var. burkii]